MTDKHSVRGALDVLRELADRLERFLDGDPTAFETLGESLDEGDYSAADIDAALMVLRSLHGALGSMHSSIQEAPGRNAQRIPSPEEREWLSPEAWTYLMEQRRRGALDSEQFEQVLGRLLVCRERPIGVEVAGQMAARVAMRFEDGADVEDIRHDELTH
jgi:uncharacterized protein Smg (DUF494 family)